MLVVACWRLHAGGCHTVGCRAVGVACCWCCVLLVLRAVGVACRAVGWRAVLLVLRAVLLVAVLSVGVLLVAVLCWCYFGAVGAAANAAWKDVARRTR